MNFGNCCIRARKAHTSMRKFSKENLAVKVNDVIVDAHLIPMKFRIEGKHPLKILLMWLLGGAAVFVLKTIRLCLRLCSNGSYQRAPSGGLP